jgi:hypothetical protein
VGAYVPSPYDADIYATDDGYGFYYNDEWIPCTRYGSRWVIVERPVVYGRGAYGYGYARPFRNDVRAFGVDGRRGFDGRGGFEGRREFQGQGRTQIQGRREFQGQGRAQVQGRREFQSQGRSQIQGRQDRGSRGDRNSRSNRDSRRGSDRRW